MKTKFFFDVDNTLTPSRSKMTDEMRALLSSRDYEYVAVSGARMEQINFQLDGVKMHTLAQNGNDVHEKDGTFLWKNELTDHEKQTILEHIQKLKEYFNLTVKDENDLIEDRLCQISYSTIGHHEELATKQAYDPDGLKRNDALAHIPFISDVIAVSIGGTTTFDYFQKGMHKGKNIERFLAHKNWLAEECIYFGDRLHPGGNDESVIGVIDTVAVQDNTDTYKKLSEIFEAQK